MVVFGDLWLAFVVSARSTIGPSRFQVLDFRMAGKDAPLLLLLFALWEEEEESSLTRLLEMEKQEC